MFFFFTEAEEAEGSSEEERSGPYRNLEVVGPLLPCDESAGREPREPAQVSLQSQDWTRSHQEINWDPTRIPVLEKRKIMERGNMND